MPEVVLEQASCLSILPGVSLCGPFVRLAAVRVNRDVLNRNLDPDTDIDISLKGTTAKAHRLGPESKESCSPEKSDARSKAEEEDVRTQSRVATTRAADVRLETLTMA